MALTKVRGGAIDNPLTLGGGSASDNSIIFDGNAQDFHIGLDDSTDSLTIGLGSTLGTTSHMVIDANGHITKPLQPAFLVRPSSQINNISSDTTITFGTEVFDQNGDFASNTFTAPVTGKYQMSFSVRVEDADTAADWLRVRLETSNFGFAGNIYDFGGMSTDPVYWFFSFSLLVDMDANDTAFVQFQQGANGTTQADIDAQSFFSGFLVC